MGIEPQSKLNRLLLDGIPGGLFFSGTLVRDGYSLQLLKKYRDSGWLESLVPGVMYRKNDKLTGLAAVYSYNQKSEVPARIVAHSALGLQGFSHFVPMGKSKLMVAFKNHNFPRWTSSDKFDETIVPLSSDIFPSPQTVEYKDDRITLEISSPEQAFMECLLLVPKHYSYMDLYYIMEMLTSLDPEKVQRLLENTDSQRAKRIFLYMAEKAGHYWFDMLDLSKVNLTDSKLQLTKGGVYNSKYRITIPKELNDYE